MPPNAGDLDGRDSTELPEDAERAEELRRYAERAREAEAERDALAKLHERAKAEARAAKKQLAAITRTSRDFTRVASSMISGGHRLEQEYQSKLDREREARAASEESQRALESLVDGIGAVAWEADPESRRFTFVARSCEELLGYPRATWTRRPDFFVEIVHAEDREAVLAFFGGAIQGGEERRTEYRTFTADGRTVWLQNTVQLDASFRDSSRLRGLMTDVTEIKRAEEERERARIREATMQVEKTERERISRELHDQVAHTMGVAHQSLELYVALSTSNPERALERLDLARESTKDALNQTRKLISDLRHSVTTEMKDGICAALERLVEKSVSEDLEGDLYCSGDESLVPREIGTQVYMIVREAVRNSLAHSGCKRLTVRVEIQPDQLTGTVADDGNGFEADPEGPRIGLRSMHERAEAVGGSLRVNSKPGVGAKIEVRVPLGDS